MTQEEERLRVFGDRLTELLGEFQDVPRGGRGFTLFMSFVALLQAEKGAPLNVAQVADMCARFAQKLYQAGLIGQTSDPQHKNEPHA